MKVPGRATATIVLLAAMTLPLLAQTKTAPPRQSLPPEMLGSYGAEASDCTDSESEGRLHVTAKSLDFIDSKLTFKRIARQQDGWWRLDGTRRETGKRGQSRTSVEIRLKSPDVLSLRNGPQKPEDFVRCKPAQLQG